MRLRLTLHCNLRTICSTCAEFSPSFTNMNEGERRNVWFVVIKSKIAHMHDIFIGQANGKEAANCCIAVFFEHDHKLNTHVIPHNEALKRRDSKP